MSDQTYKQDIEQGNLSSARGVSDPLAAVKQLHTRVYKCRKRIAATGVELIDAMAADTTAESMGGRFEFPGIVTKIVLTLEAALVGDAANNFILTVSKRDAAGINKTTVGVIDSDIPGGGSFVAFLGEELTLTNANVVVVAGGSFTWEIAKAGAGVAVPVFEIAVHVLDQ